MCLKIGLDLNSLPDAFLQPNVHLVPSEPRSVLFVLSVVANAEEAHTGWRLLDCYGNQISSDICYKHMFNQTTCRLPVLVLDRD